MTALQRLGIGLANRQRGLLLALLAVLHLSLLVGGSQPFGLVWWLIEVGLFMLWQPFVHAGRRLSLSSCLGVAAILAVGLWGYGNWLLLLWAAFLAALVGGRVLFVAHRATRLYYLLAFAYLLAAVLLHLVPGVVPTPGTEELLLARVFAWGGGAVLLAMSLIPLRVAGNPVASGPVDFVNSLFVFLLVAVLVLGSLAFMVVRQSAYVEALLGTLAIMGGMLLLLAWAWDPRPGFGGVGALFSRYLLTVGLPIEAWLHGLTRIAEEVRDPAAFAERALVRMLELPWVVGGEWEAAGAQGNFGERGPYSQAFGFLALNLRLHTRYRLSPALIWHFRLLVRLVAEYHQAKMRERELEQMGYLRAVYETGARLTHDVKNLLQSLNNLCYVAQSLEGERAADIQPLMRKQLPLIVQRLELTLDKLRRPRGGSGPVVGAEPWWISLRQRYEPQDVLFFSPACLSEATIPTSLFDSVVDNLLQNAIEKRRREPGISIRVEMLAGGRGLTVADSGSPVPAAQVSMLLRAPVLSDDGLGIGLFHAALQATEQGYALRLAENRVGEVRFELSQVLAVPTATA